MNPVDSGSGNIKLQLLFYGPKWLSKPSQILELVHFQFGAPFLEHVSSFPVFHQREFQVTTQQIQPEVFSFRVYLKTFYYTCLLLVLCTSPRCRVAFPQESPTLFLPL